jgi:copper(I)-binding protein
VKRYLPLFIPLLAIALVVPAVAHHYELGKLVIGHPWSRSTPTGMSTGVAYLSITNSGTETEVLTGASSPAATSVQFHETSISGGMARMRPLTEIVIAPGATVRIEPGAIHLMLIGLKAPLEAGKSVPLTLEFRRAGSITVQHSDGSTEHLGDFALEPPTPGAPSEHVIAELRRCYREAKDYTGALSEAMKSQAEKYQIAPAALRKYIAALEGDGLEDARKEADDLARLIEDARA